MAEKHSRLGKGLNSIFGTTTVTVGKGGENDSNSIETPVTVRRSKTAEKSISINSESKAHNAESTNDMTNQSENHSDAEGLHTVLKINLIQPNLNQPRKDFPEEELHELSESIKNFGVIQPLIVQKQGALYEIIAGERRWRAAKIAGLKEVPVIVRNFDEKTAKEIAIIENIQRSNLNAVEEAFAYQSLLSEYGMTQEELSQRVAKKRSTITNSLRILKLEPEILSMIREGSLSQGHGRALLGIEDAKKRVELAQKCVTDGLSVRDIENIAKNDPVKVKLKKTKDVNSERMQLIYKDLEKRLKEHLGTKVSIVPKDEKRGKVEIEYYSQEELDHLFILLNSIKDDGLIK